MLSFASPAEPKLLPKIDDWAGAVDTEIELDNVAARDKNFAHVRHLEIEGCRLEAIQLAEANLDKLRVSDAVLTRVEAAGMHANGAAALRVVLKDSRLTGADFGASLLEDCLFDNVKFDEAGFRFAACKRVRFENCVLRNADFSGAKLTNVSFSGCELKGANFDNATCKAVDLRGEALADIKGIFGLKGATISSEQLIQLAPLLAAEAELDIDYET
jgi:uncharacterized protein YjbI with pentapeptide repeats